MYSRFAETNEIKINLSEYYNDGFKIELEERSRVTGLWADVLETMEYSETINAENVRNKLAHFLHDVNLSAYPTRIVALHNLIDDIREITIDELIAEYKQIATPNRKNDYFV